MWHALPACMRPVLSISTHFLLEPINKQAFKKDGRKKTFSGRHANYSIIRSNQLATEILRRKKTEKHCMRALRRTLASRVSAQALDILCSLPARLVGVGKHVRQVLASALSRQGRAVSHQQLDDCSVRDWACKQYNLFQSSLHENFQSNLKQSF